MPCWRLVRGELAGAFEFCVEVAAGGLAPPQAARSAEAAKHPPLKSAHPADRTLTLTAETIKDAKMPQVATCRSCHAQEGAKPKIGDAIPEVTYEGDTDPTVLDNEQAYHRNCNGCHDAAVEKRKLTTAPTTNECIKCHTGK